jgi:protein-S-isoprenylcysteine O-methyltransferase Ste14
VKSFLKKLLLALMEPVEFGVLIFSAAFTLRYWQAWVFLAAFVVPGWLFGIYLLRTNPAALERRSRGGPTAEARPAQKAVMGIAWLSLAAMMVVSALDHRFGWSHVPTAICVVGVVLVAVGVSVMMLVVVQNRYASATIRVESDQQLISTGLYGLVRHPMYTGNVILMVGIPLALGSYWGLVFVVTGLIVLTWRIRDEEKLLREELDGYHEYTQKVRSRLVPCMW